MGSWAYTCFGHDSAHFSCGGWSQGNINEHLSVLIYRGVNQLTGSLTSLNRKMHFLQTGIGIPTVRMDENLSLADSDPFWK